MIEIQYDIQILAILTTSDYAQLTTFFIMKISADK